MRWHYLSDLHLERQDFAPALPRGDVLLIAGDLCEACCLAPGRSDRPSLEQRDRVLRFRDAAVRNFAHVVLVAGNHEPCHGVLEDTADLLRAALDGITVLDDSAVDIAGVQVFGTTLWTDFDDGSRAAMDAVRRRMSEFFFVRTRAADGAGPVRFQPEHALQCHRRSVTALRAAVGAAAGRKTVVVSHHAPSRRGLNSRFAGNGLDPAYASTLDAEIAASINVPVWVHGHTHVACRYAIGATQVLSNAYGFAARGSATPGFSTRAAFDLA